MLGNLMHPDAYAILAAPSSAEIKIKGSRFLALAFPVHSEEEATAIRSRLENEYKGASHYCWSLRLGSPEQIIERNSDAGEPAGSAGAPMARALKSSELSDLLVVVIRWFGGTKLGVGGLIRAYGEAAALSLTNAERGERMQTRRLTGTLPFEFEGDLRALLARYEGRIQKLDYHEDGFHIDLRLPASLADTLKENVRDLSRGRHALADSEESGP
jgi:uncharacterized YigZ family protein